MTTRDLYFAALPQPTAYSPGYVESDKAALWEAGVPIEYVKVFPARNAAAIIELHQASVPAEYGRRLLGMSMWPSTVTFLHTEGVPLEYALLAHGHLGPTETARLSQAGVPLGYAIPLKDARKGYLSIIRFYEEGIPVEFAAELDSETGFEVDLSGD